MTTSFFLRRLPAHDVRNAYPQNVRHFTFYPFFIKENKKAQCY